MWLWAAILQISSGAASPPTWLCRSGPSPPIMQTEPHAALVRIIQKKPVDPPGVKRTALTHDAVHLISFLQHELRQIVSILPSDSRNHRSFHPFVFLPSVISPAEKPGHVIAAGIMFAGWPASADSLEFANEPQGGHAQIPAVELPRPHFPPGD